MNGVDIPEPEKGMGFRALRRRITHWLGMGLVVILLAAGVLLWLIDTSPGHRFLADRISAIAPSSGLRIRIGRIDGSIYSRASLRDVRLYDPQGLFLEAPELDLNWRPTAWLPTGSIFAAFQRTLAILYRVPRLRPSPNRRKAILPGFDIRIDRLDIRKLRLEPAIAGTRHFAHILGKADIRHGRALINLAAASTAKDQVRIKLDAEPGRDRFDLDTRILAPAKGVIGGAVGTQRPIAVDISGEGRWTSWSGKALVDVSGNRIVDLALLVNAGHYKLSGSLAPASITSGKLHRLSMPAIRVEGDAVLADRRLTSRLLLRSPALKIAESGVLNLADSSFEAVTVDFDLLKPPALFPNMTGRDIRLHASFNGPFATAAFDYALKAPRVAFDTTGFEAVHITGHGNLSKAPISLPVKLTAQRVTGVGDVAGGILRNLSVNGVVKVTARELSGQGLRLSSDKIRGKLALIVDLTTGKYSVGMSGSLTRYLIPGLGIVDVMTDLKVVPGGGGHGTFIQGRGHAWVRRFDNAFLRSLAGGLPRIETQLSRGPDGILHFANLHLIGPDIELTGNGYRRHDGTFYFQGAGSQRRYGPLNLTLDGNISHPKLDIALARPMDSLGLAAVRLQLDPFDRGFEWRAEGGSTIGPFTGNGRIILQPNSPALIAIAALDVSGTHATGGLRADPGGFTGKIITAGGGIDGNLFFNPVDNLQRIEAHLAFARVHFAGAADLGVRRGGRLDGSMLLDPAGLTVDGTLAARGIAHQRLLLGRLSAQVSLKAGRGADEG